MRRLEGLTVPTAIVGHVTNPAIYYALMDVFCLPSYREGFGNVVIEASASSVPVVTSNATGVVDAISDGETGLMSTVGDSVDLARALGAILRDSGLAAQLGQAGRQWVTSRFARTDVQRAYADDLQAILMSMPRARPEPTESPA